MSTIVSRYLVAGLSLSRIDTTYVVAAVCGIAATGAFIGLILVPAVGAYRRSWQRLIAVVLSFYVLAAMMGIGLLGAGAVIWIWGRYG